MRSIMRNDVCVVYFFFRQITQKMVRLTLLLVLLLLGIYVNHVVDGMTNMGAYHRMKTGFGKREVDNVASNLVVSIMHAAKYGKTRALYSPDQSVYGKARVLPYLAPPCLPIMENTD